MAQVLMNEVQSSNIRSIGFDNTAGKPGTGKLYVQFRNNPKVYKYLNVPFAVHIAFMNAESKGNYFAQIIKPTYPVEGGPLPGQMPPDQPAPQEAAPVIPEPDATNATAGDFHPATSPRVILDTAMPDDAVVIRCGKQGFAKVVAFLDNVRVEAM